jgi:hypothetical protein
MEPSSSDRMRDLWEKRMALLSNSYIIEEEPQSMTIIV